MPSTDLMKKTEQAMVICNACRYCEGFCAVFPAMELRRTFSEADLKYLANLCHNCRACYYACQYAPPHEFDLNLPKSFAELRLKTYEEFAWPDFLGTLFRRNGLAVWVIAAFCVALVVGLTIAFQGLSVVFGIHAGPEAFYQVIPSSAMVAPMSAIGLLALVCLAYEIGAMWRRTGGNLRDLFRLRPNFRAVTDTLQLKYLDGHGHGCNYPDERFSMSRRYFHHLVFYGFGLCFASTCVAAFYDHFLHLSAPYPFLSWPVILGTSGGIALLVGTAGLLYLRCVMDPTPATPRSTGLDVGFTGMLFLITLTGLLLLFLRETAAMGMLLAIHIGLVLALFITLPYGKFVHSIYRYAALVRNAKEQSSGEKK